jgi:long-chain acyl-CoA synthetase
MLTLQPEIAQAMVWGDRRPYLVGLIVPEQDWTSEWAKARGKAPAAVRDDPDYQRALSAAVDRVNGELSVLEKVRRFILADAPFTVENQQLTPSIKIRRHVLKAVYGERLDALYKK